ncbi:glucose 1-dehydrogenase [Halioxenophilus sp. WMMB6]|uniref:glucose 1-dehydrogenase n=1 Tax=Halioxenophilus sp. WMMB6 TaxID=3073815 RepID=UPI00295E68AE|nr:glucose 1-dehydrogenase [Halioxenophilus sp. WMMB6]
MAVITGGASGIGRATVELFVEEGAKVVFADVNDDAGKSLEATLGGNAIYKHTDVSKPEELQALVDCAITTFGGLHIMFNNAGISGAQYDRFLDDPFDDFDKVVGINWLGVIKGSQFAGRHMAKNGGGVILNNASIAGVLPGHALMTYRSTKAAVILASKSMAIDLAEYGIRVNCLIPGHIRTPLNAYTEPGMSEAQSQKVRDALAPVWDSNQPLKRHGAPRDVAQAALFLCSDRAAQITGITMPIDGGITAGDPVNHLREIWDARAQALAEFS